jgi:YXWGXW repeat-containing protein
MKSILRLSLVASFGVLVTVASVRYQARLAAQPGAGTGTPDDVEVLTRGPIHEAFAQPTTQMPAPGPIVPKKPPAPLNELPPDAQPEGDMMWIPGYWSYDDERGDFLWVSGIWRAPPPDRQWMPGYWEQIDGGYRWISGYWAGRTDTTAELLPALPEPIQEAVPPAPNANDIYAPGTWVYQDNRYWWRPGQWIAGRAGWIWNPAHYVWTPGGYVFVDGYWDYDLDRRGITFAPVYVSPNVYARPGWAYRPQYALGVNALLGSLFVRPAVNQYFFGDYYDPGYARRGYTPWVDYRVHSGVADPLLGYYRWQHRNDAQWERQLNTLYATRRTNVNARPPRTLVLQERKGVDSALRVAVPLKNLNTTAFKLQPVTKAHVEEIRKNNENWHNFSVQRGRVETAVKHPVAPSVKTPHPPPARVTLPKTTVQHPTVKNTPPPRPVAPKVTPKAPPPHKEKGKASLPGDVEALAQSDDGPRWDVDTSPLHEAPLTWLPLIRTSKRKLLT